MFSVLYFVFVFCWSSSCVLCAWFCQCKHSRMDNPETLENQAHKTQDKQNTKTQYNTENNQEWTTQRHWQN
jgi:hypothetical protein